MSTTTHVRWGLILVTGLVAEIAILVVVLPVNFAFGEQALLYATPPVCFAVTFLVGRWIGRRVGSRALVHGLLMGIVAALVYVGLTLAAPEPLLYIIANGLKILGGAVGAATAVRRTTPVLV